MSIRVRPLRSTAAALASMLAVGGGLSIVSALPAMAAPMDPAVSGYSGSIVVTKYQNPTAVPLPEGTGMPTTPTGSALPGVHFRVCPVTGSTTHSFPTTSPTYSPSDSEWWMIANQIVADFNAAPSLGTLAIGASCFDGITDSIGQIVFGDGGSDTVSGTTYQHGGSTGSAGSSGLPLGMYVVQEIPEPSSVITPVAPYLVTLPFLYSDTSSGVPTQNWIARNSSDPGLGDYIVWTYPKNATVSVKKTADTNRTYSMGSTISYTITTPIPNKVAPAHCSISGVSVDDCVTVSGTVIPEGPNLTSLILTDTLSTGLNFVVDLNTKLLRPTVTIGPDATHPTAQTLQYGVHYTVTPSSPPMGREATITFTPTGIQVVNTYAVGAPITVAFQAEVGDVPSTTSGQANVTNSVTVTWDDASAADDVITNMGGVMINKQNSATHELLAGAIFQIYGSDPATAGASPIQAATLGAGTGSGGSAYSFAQCTMPELTTQSACETAGGIWQPDGQIGILGLRYYTPADPDSPAPTCYMTAVAGTTSTEWQSHFASLTGTCSNTSIATRSECVASGGSWTWMDSGTVLPSTARLGTTYWIVETTAPVGYILDPTPHQVCVTGVLDGVGASYDDFYVDNQPTDIGIQLPFTGDSSKYIPVALGALFTVGACTFYAIRSKKINARSVA